MSSKLLYYCSFFLGLLLAVLCSLRVGGRRGLPRREAALFTVTGFLSGVLGAVLMTQIYNIVLRAAGGGAAFTPSIVSLYGGLLFLPLLILPPVRLTGADYRGVLDTCAAGVYLLLGAAKLGCFSYGCCYGVACDVGFYNRFAGERVFPVQLAEAAVSFLIAGLLYRLAVRQGSASRRLPAGGIYPLGLALYGAARFGLQFLRAHEIPAEADLLGFLDLWQIVSCVAVLTGAVWLAALYGARKRTGSSAGAG